MATSLPNTILLEYHCPSLLVSISNGNPLPTTYNTILFMSPKPKNKLVEFINTIKKEAKKKGMSNYTCIGLDKELIKLILARKYLNYFINTKPTGANCKNYFGFSVSEDSNKIQFPNAVKLLCSKSSKILNVNSKLSAKCKKFETIKTKPPKKTSMTSAYDPELQINSVNNYDINLVKEKITNPYLRDWNSEFQNLLSEYLTNEKAFDRIISLCREFTKVAKDIGKVIISELNLPNSQKTIPPITQSIGGLAGGEKYIYDKEKIFFKLSVDAKGIYGGTEFCMKTAGHELKSVVELLKCRIPGLHFPLMVVVDYRGHRLTAMTLLPITRSSLIYGSADGGVTVCSTSPEMEQRMNLVGKLLNLAPHRIWDYDYSKYLDSCVPVDLEGHLGSDNRFYIVDPARLLPPAVPTPGMKGSQLYRLLRPEFVKRSPVPLCSDAFGSWHIDNLEKYNEDIQQATLRLETQEIAKMAALLEHWWKSLGIKGSDNLPDFEELRVKLHDQGINLRYLGMIRILVKDFGLKQFILTEIVARVIRKILFSRLRELNSAEDVAYLRMTIDYFTLLFTSETSEYWNSFKLSLLKRFKNALTPEEKEHNCDLRNYLITATLLQRAQEICGIKFSPQCLKYFENDSIGVHPAEKFPLHQLVEIYPIEKSNFNYKT